MTHDLSASDVIAMFDLHPLPGEGGFFRETWKLPDPESARPRATSILYLVTPTSFSALHRLDHDEMFHVYAGDPCHMVMVDPGNEVHEISLGADLAAGMVVQHLVPEGWWQGTRLAPGGRWALLGTTNSPGFTPEGFELATSAHLESFPDHVRLAVRDLIAG
jgi:hypothetical protein